MALGKENKGAGPLEIFKSFHSASGTARMTVNYPEGSGVFFFANGELVNAQFGELSGNEAVGQASGLCEEGFRIDLDVAVPEPAIFSKTEELFSDQAGEPGIDLPAHQQLIANPSASSFRPLQELQQRDESLTEQAREDLTMILNGASAPADHRTFPLREVRMEATLNQQFVQHGQPPLNGIISSAEEEGETQQLLSATGMMQSGVVIDEDGITIGEVGKTDPALAQTAFMIAGLESLVSAQFDSGGYEGALLDQAGTATLVTKASGLSCAFLPVPRVPVARAFNETRRVLENLAGERA